MRSLHWFRQDLRLTDNSSLEAINQRASELLCVYVLDEKLIAEAGFSAHELNLSKTNDKGVGINTGFVIPLSNHRLTFLLQSLNDLKTSLQNMGQNLLVLVGEPVSTISDLITSHDIQLVSSSWHCGPHEINQWQALKTAQPMVEYLQKNSATIYQGSDFPFSLDSMPDTFSPFRRKVEKYCDVELQLSNIDEFSPTLDIAYTDDLQANYVDNSSNEYIGGHSAAITRIKEYFWQSDNIASYKETRNGLDGWEFSSRLSAWLANGSISPLQILSELAKYEHTRTKNESTYWLFFELLWREFFHWQQFKYGSRLFKKSGIQGKHLSTSLDKQAFASWVNGTTGYKIVDACMKQLKQTGFMSNRGRQLVASCLVHELNLDWRYGAAYFEHQLIDFDVASNYGNWQYLAGVGADPRGHRQFNLQKQTEIYDPSLSFVERWA